jgi:hypothetical protein
MIKENPKQCKSKSCFNPVLDGKYCVNCKQIRKERKEKILVGIGAGVPVIFGCVVAIKKGGIKQVPKIAAKVLKVILRK